MANIDDSKASVLAESAETAEKSAMETIANDEVSTYENKAADNLDSAMETVHDPSIEASEKSESCQSKFINVKQASPVLESGEASLTDRSMENSSTALSTESESDSESLFLPLSIRSLSFPLYILAWFSNLCSKKSFMFSTKAQAPKALQVNPNTVHHDLADGAKAQAPEELEVSTYGVNEDLQSASSMAVENAMKESLDVSTSAIEQDALADADDQIEDTDKVFENPMTESLHVSTNAVEQDDLAATAYHNTDDTAGKDVEGAEKKNINEAPSLQVGRVEESVGRYTRAIKSQVLSTLEDSVGSEARRAFKYQMNGVEEARSFKYQASTEEVSVGEATTAYRSKVEALKIKFESFRI